MTDTSAVIHTRLTLSPAKEPAQPDIPGVPGKVALQYWSKEDMSDFRIIPDGFVTAANDFTYKFRLHGLRADTRYYYRVRMTNEPGNRDRWGSTRSFRTAPLPKQRARVCFTAVSGQAFREMDSGRGFRIYPIMSGLDPQFLVSAGNNVHYDLDSPRVSDIPKARLHWHRMYSMPDMIEFFSETPVYFLKNDRDWRYADADPFATGLLWLTAQEGTRVFSEQVPVQDPPYRTFRWGKGMQIWFLESREFRSANDAPDGPHKIIWGQRQRQWLMDTLLQSDAPFKVVVSPTPIIGPAAQRSKDSHASEAFAYERERFLLWTKEHSIKGLYIVSGGLPWQHHSLDRGAGVSEFSTGPASDGPAKSAFLQRPSEVDELLYYEKQGGFLEVCVDPGEDFFTIRFRFYDTSGSVGYEWSESDRTKEDR